MGGVGASLDSTALELAEFTPAALPVTSMAPSFSLALSPKLPSLVEALVLHALLFGGSILCVLTLPLMSIFTTNCFPCLRPLFK